MRLYFIVNCVKGILEVKISCSSGTYIRAIARDLGRILGSEGCLLFLKRISACGFHENNSIKITELSNNTERNSNLIIPTLSALDHISTLFLDNEDEINFWRTGRAIDFQFFGKIRYPAIDWNMLQVR